MTSDNNNGNQSKKTVAKNWDQIVRDFEKEEEEENKKSDGSVDDLFRQIYEKGGEDVRKAMNKSFTESGGTVLSTNWSEVCKSKTEVKLPDGCEYKKYD